LYGALQQCQQQQQQFVKQLQTSLLDLTLAPLCDLCCCLFLQMVMGGRYYSISPDEYVFAALNIYLVSSWRRCVQTCRRIQQQPRAVGMASQPVFAFVSSCCVS
jgi:hypothetical protein